MVLPIRCLPPTTTKARGNRVQSCKHDENRVQRRKGVPVADPHQQRPRDGKRPAGEPSNMPSDADAVSVDRRWFDESSG